MDPLKRADFAEQAARLDQFIRLRYKDSSDFGRVAGIHSNLVWSYRRGEKTPGAASFLGFLKAGLNVVWMLTGEGSPDYRPEGVTAIVDEQRELTERARGHATELLETLNQLSRTLGIEATTPA